MQTSYSRSLYGLVLALALAYFVFTVFPGIDIKVSSWFFDEAAPGWPNGDAWYGTYRAIFNAVSISLAVLSLVMWIVSFWRGPILEIPPQVWGFVTLLYVTGPGLLVNVLFKNNWGRARPADVVEFGGNKMFTPAFEISDQCARNCSFVSGEGSSAAAFFIAILVLSAFIHNRSLRYAVLFVSLFFALITAFMRVAKGRHFLSDTLGSILFVSLVAVLLHWLLIGRKRPS
ncbi:MAG: phosphatase PAP2 family protein [Hyphomicrobiales bacterium]|nr:phosphatase PAP2 family protein [Hyphomicrobiales bacterium]MCP4997485.1 phosphatase PAP2 family protein [Hyphomicrobiales bacterium]